MRYDAGTYDIAVIGAGHAGIEAALAGARLGLEDPVLHRQPGRGGQHALQPGHRRHRQGPPGPGAGRPGGRDGPRRRQGLHPVPAAEPGQGPRRPLPAGPGRPSAVPGGHEAHPGAAGEPLPAPGRGGGHPDRGRPCGRRGHRHRGGVPGARLRHRHRHLSGGPHHCGRGRSATRGPTGSRPPER